MSFCQLPLKNNWKAAQHEPAHCSPAVHDVTDTTIYYDNVRKRPHLPLFPAFIKIHFRQNYRTADVYTPNHHVPMKLFLIHHILLIL